MSDGGLLETAYDSFFLRDIAYIVSGLWLMFHLSHIILNYDLTQFIGHLTTSTLAFLAYGAIGYFVGMFGYLAALHIKIIHTDPPHFEKNYDKARSKICKLDDNYIRKTLERSTFIQMACFSIFISSLLAIIAHLIHLAGSNSPCSFDGGYFLAALIVCLFSYFVGVKEVLDEDAILMKFVPDQADPCETEKKEQNTPQEPKFKGTTQDR